MLAALHFRNPRAPGLGDAGWRDALDFADRSHLTLVLRDRMRDSMPRWVRERTDRNAEQNLERVRSAQELYRHIHERSRRSGNSLCQTELHWWVGSLLNAKGIADSLGGGSFGKVYKG